MPNLSIIITAKNAQEYLSETLKSINDSLHIEDLELVFIDDGSFDETGKIVNDFKFNDFITLKYEYVELGRSKALNYGLMISSSDVICILDSDDLFHPSKLNIQYDLFKREKMSFLACDYVTGNKPGKDFFLPLVSDNKLKEIKIKDLIKRNYICHSSVMFDREIVEYSEHRNMQIDLDMWFRILRNGYNIYILREPLVFKRIHPNQSFESKKRIKYAVSSYLLTLSNAKPYHKNILEIFYRTFKLGFHLTPRFLTKYFKL